MTENRTLWRLGIVAVLLVVGASTVAPTAAVQTDGGEYVEIEDGSTYWVGQTLRSYAFDASDSVELFRGDEFVSEKEVRTDADGDHYVAVDSTDIGSGEYTLRAEDGQTVSFTLYRQDYRAYFDEFSVNNAGDDTTTEITITSNRRGYTHVVTSPDANATELREILGTGTVEDVDPAAENGPELVVKRGAAGRYDRFDANFSGVETGQFTLNFEVPETDATASASVTVEEYVPPNPSARFDISGENVVVEQRGDVVEIPVSVTDTDRATVYLGGRDLNYLVRATVETGFDDEATLTWNTDDARRTDDPADVFGVAESSDEIVSVERIAGKNRLPNGTRISAGSYPLWVEAGPDGNRTDNGLVRLDPVDTIPRSIQPRRARTGIASEDLTIDNTEPATTIANGDALLLRVQSAGLYGYVSSRDDVAFSDVLSLSVVKTSVGPNEPEGSVPTIAFTEIRTEPETDAILFGVDTHIEKFEVGETYRATFRIDGSAPPPANPYVDGDVTVKTTFEIVPRSLSTNTVGGVVRVQSEDDQVISGTSTVADGTPVTITVRSDGEKPFFETRRTTVENGTWGISLDVFRDVPTGQRFTVRIDSPGFDRRSLDGVVSPPASVSVDDQTGTELLTVESASLPSGGFLVVYGDGNAGRPGSVLGTSSFLPPGDHSDVRIPLSDPIEGSTSVVVVAHTDTDGNGVFEFPASNGSTDRPYDTEGDPVSDTASLTVPTATVTETATATATTTETATATRTRTATATTTETETVTATATATPTRTRTRTETPTATTDGESTPGFGVLAAVVAVLVAVVLRRRLRE